MYNNNAIEIESLGKMYKLYKNPKDKILDAFGLNFWKKDYYKEFWAIRNLDLVIKKGERIGLIGNNGAGKSTLLKTIIGNITPTEGRVCIKGQIQALMELGTGFHPEFTGRENIRASLAYQGLSQKEIAMREEEIIEFSELEDFIDQPIRTYSAGMNARLAFSTATSIKPDILIIDEVLGAGDAYFAGKCVDRMKKLTDESGATVLFVSHDLSSILQLCDKVIWIDRGQIRMQGNPLEVVKEYTALVRKREEIRLKARDLKISKKQAALLEKKEDLYDSILFHFTGIEGNSPEGKNKIYKIKLLCNKEEIGFIEVGGPMDNSLDQDHHIIEEKGYMDWGSSQKDSIGMYREFKNLQGQYKHAPFEFKIPKNFEKDDLILQIECNLEDVVLLEIYSEGEYKYIGTLTPNGQYIYEFNLKMDISKENNIKHENDDEESFEKDYDIEIKKEESDSIKEQDSIYKSKEELFELGQVSQYGNHQAKITNLRMLNSQGRDCKIFEVGEKIEILIEYKSSVNIDGAVFVFCIYTPDGKCASQWIADETIYEKSKLPKKGNFRFIVDKLLIGKGSYVASVAIFKNISKGNIEAESYHVIDKSIHFEIRQSIMDNIDRGFCVQPFKGVVAGD